MSLSMPLKAAKPVATIIAAATLGDLSREVWRIVAIQAAVSAKWDWTLTPENVARFKKARNEGIATSVRGRSGGQIVIFGKWAKYPPKKA